MRNGFHLQFGLFICLLAALPVPSQAPTAIQLFMPGGALPAREMRFTLTRDDGRVEILFTDTKGKYQLTGDLARERDYTIVIEGDGKTFETTTARFRVLRNISYVPVFLRPLKGEPPPREIVDASAFDAKAPAEARAAYDQAMRAVGENNAGAAIGEFTRALTIYPQYPRALNDLGVLYLKLNRLDEAAGSFTQAISLNSRFYFPRLNLGVVHNRQGRFAEAAKLFGQLLKDQPSLAAARLPYAEALSGLERFEEAAEQLRDALADKTLDPAKQAEAHFSLGMLLSRQERYADAAAEMEKAIAINPNAANAWLYLGGAQLQLNKTAEAEKSLVKAYELGGNRVAGAQLFLGQLYFQQRKFVLALRAFEQYLKDLPNAPNAAQVKVAVDKIKAEIEPK